MSVTYSVLTATAVVIHSFSVCVCIRCRRRMIARALRERCSLELGPCFSRVTLAETRERLRATFYATKTAVLQRCDRLRHECGKRVCLGSLTNSYIYASPLYACVRYGEHAVVG